MRSEAGLLRVPIDLGERAHVVTCALEPRQQARLADAMRGRISLDSVATFDELARLLRTSIAPVDVVVLASRERSGRSAEQYVRDMTAERPLMAIVAICSPVSPYSTDIRALAAAGVHEIVLQGVSDEGAALRDTLARARRHCTAGWLMRQVSPCIPSRLHPIAEAVFSKPEKVVTIAALADELHVHRKTLFNWCRRDGWPSPAELMAWCRLVVVGYHLDNTGCTIETIALELSYPSDNSLRNTIKRYTHMTASQLRDQGAVASVLDALLSRHAS